MLRDTGGDTTGDVTTEAGSERLGVGSGWGAGALVVRVGVGAAAGGGAEGGAPYEIAPFSRLTSFGGAVLPEKNSPAVSAGSAEGARGKISAWKESAWTN